MPNPSGTWWWWWWIWQAEEDVQQSFHSQTQMANQICDFTCKLWGNTQQVWWLNTHLIYRYLFCVQVRFVDNLHSHVAIISAAECWPVRQISSEWTSFFFATLRKKVKLVYHRHMQKQMTGTGIFTLQKTRQYWCYAYCIQTPGKSVILYFSNLRRLICDGEIKAFSQLISSWNSPHTCNFEHQCYKNEQLTHFWTICYPAVSYMYVYVPSQHNYTLSARCHHITTTQYSPNCNFSVLLNTMTPELNPPEQRCLPEVFYSGF